MDIDPETQKRLEEFLNAPKKWIEEPEAHEALGLPKNKVRRINAVMQRLEHKWRGEDLVQRSPRGSEFNLKTELRRMQGVIGSLEAMWKEDNEMNEFTSNRQSQAEQSSLDLSELQSVNQSAYWRAGRYAVYDENAIASVEKPLFDTGIQEEIRQINMQRLRKTENWRSVFEKAIYDQRCREEVDMNELPGSVSYSLHSSDDSMQGNIRL